MPLIKIPYIAYMPLANTATNEFPTFAFKVVKNLQPNWMPPTTVKLQQTTLTMSSTNAQLLMSATTPASLT